MKSSKPDTKKQEAAAQEQVSISRQQLDLEKQRLDAEKQQTAQREQELSYLQQQIQAQNTVYNKQIGLLSSQNTAAQNLAKQQADVLVKQTNASNQQRKIAEAENNRSQYQSQQEQLKATEGLTSLLGATSSRRKLARKSTATRKTASSFNMAERNSLLSTKR